MIDGSRTPDDEARDGPAWAYTISSALVWWSIAGCGGGAQPFSTPDSSVCGLSRTARQLLLQLVNQAEGALAGALSNGGPQDLQIQFALLGIDMMQGVAVHLATPCVGSNVSGVTCSSDLASNPSLVSSLDTCFQTGCEGPGIPFVNVYVTQTPHRASEDRIDISYAMQAPYPAGQVTYSPNPLVYWRYDLSNPGSLAVSADLTNTVSVVTGQGGAIDCSYSGRLDGTRVTDTIYTVNLIFPRIAVTGPVKVSIQNTSTAPRKGLISIGSATIATLSQGGVTWNSDCRVEDGSVD
jgi:hypothetical protein